MRVIKNSWLFFVSIIFLFCSSSISYPQNYGISIGGSSEKVIFGDIFYKKMQHNFHVGFSYQISNAKGEEKYERKSNYGLTTSGSGDKFYTVDLSYGYEIIDTVEIFVELSIGQKKYYTNYIDNRFKDGGYHLINDDEMITGIGLGASYAINNMFRIFASYNSIRKIGVGIRFLFTYY